MLDPTDLAKRIRDVNPNVVDKTERSADANHPYRLRQYFSLPSSDFTVELTVHCKIAPGGFELASFLTDSDTHLIAEYPTLLVSELLSHQEKQSMIDEWVRRLCDFLALDAPIIVRCLEEKK